MKMVPRHPQRGHTISRRNLNRLYWDHLLHICLSWQHCCMLHNWLKAQSGWTTVTLLSWFGPYLYLLFRFLLNPMTIATCVAQSLQTVENALVIATVCAAVCGKFVLASILLGLLINFSPYYVTILVPLAWVVQESKHLAWKDSQNKLESSTAITSSALSIVKTISFIASSAIFAAAFLFVSFLLAGSQTWEFFWKSYGFFCTLPP